MRGQDSQSLAWDPSYQVAGSGLSMLAIDLSVRIIIFGTIAITMVILMIDRRGIGIMM